MAPNFGLVCVLAAVTAAAAPHHLRHGTTCAGELVMFDNRYHPPVPSKGSIGSQSYWWRALAANQLYGSARACWRSLAKTTRRSAATPFRALKKTLEAPYTTKVNNRVRTSRGTTQCIVSWQR